MTDIKTLRALLAAATPGPLTQHEVGYEIYAPPGVMYDDMPVANCQLPSDAALITAAVNALPALLDQLEAVTKERDELRAALEKFDNEKLSEDGGFHNCFFCYATKGSPPAHHADWCPTAISRAVLDKVQP